jgi:hypothetical protein
VEWDLVGGAAAYGQFAGLMAGVAFIGLTLILTRQIPTVTDQQRRLARASISDFLLAFVTLGLSAMDTCGRTHLPRLIGNGDRSIDAVRRAGMVYPRLAICS